MTDDDGYEGAAEPHGEVETTMSDIDPWGRPRVQGFGAAPFEVLTTVPD